MQSRFLLQVVLTISLLILSRANDVIGPGYSCFRRSVDDDGQTRVTFLREGDAPGVRLLYLTVWSHDLRLVTCQVHTNPLVAARYRTLCDRSGTQGQKLAPRFNISALVTSDAPCVPKFTRRSRTDGTRGKVRRKRAWILPGTLWCGKGSDAVKYEQLGMFENTDRCCREHDHCLHIIPAFRVNYGVFNPNFYAVSHCECDQRFRRCLLGVNDTISTMVGYSFFNILRIPCFELKQQRRCTEIYWWGMCKVAKEAPYAVFKNPLPYNTSDTKSNVALGDIIDSSKSRSEGQHITERPTIKLHRKLPNTKRRCGSRGPPMGDTFHDRRAKGKACRRHSAVAPSKMLTISKLHSTSSSIKVGPLNVSKSKTLMTNKKRAGKSKSKRINLSAPSKGTTNSYPQRSSTTNGTPSLTQKQTLQLHKTMSMKIDKKVPKRSHCCRSRMPLRGGTFWPDCKSCLETETTHDLTTVTPETTTNASPANVTMLQTMQFKTTTTYLMAVTAKPKSRATNKPQKQMDSYLLQANTSQEAMGSTLAQSSHAVRSSRQNNALRNMTDNQSTCESLKHLDKCKYKIPPLEKKYDLHNMDSKTAYHCDCTSRLAVQFERFNQPSTLPMLLKDFVSQYCFKLPKGKKCHSRKRFCSGGFTEATDLLQKLKKEEGNSTTGAHNSGTNRKRETPVRLYKQCLRLEREADIMVQLTLL